MCNWVYATFSYAVLPVVILLDTGESQQSFVFCKLNNGGKGTENVDISPDADMEEDENSDYELEDDSYSAPSSSQHGAEPLFKESFFGVAAGLALAWAPPKSFPAPAATAGSTWMPADTPSQHAAFGMPHIFFPLPIMYNRYPQMAVSDAPGYRVLPWAQPAGYPGAESGSAHQSWEQRELQSQRSRKRKNHGRSEGQKRTKSGGTASNAQQGIAQQGIAQQGIAQQSIAQQVIAQQVIAQQGIAQQGIAQHGIAQPEAFVLRCNARLDAVANAMRQSTAVGTDAAVVASAGGEAKPAAAGPDAQGMPFTHVGTFASSSYGSPSVQATVLSGGVQFSYNFSSFYFEYLLLPWSAGLPAGNAYAVLATCVIADAKQLAIYFCMLLKVCNI